MILLILIAGGLNCRKTNAAPPSAQIRGGTDYAAILKAHKWGFSKGDAPPILNLQ